MKAVSSTITRGLETESFLKCADNSGADELQIIQVINYKGVKKRRARCGIADVVVATVKKGDQKIKHEVVRAVIVRQRREFMRRNGMRVSFEDNAAVIVNEKGEPKGTRIKGPIAKEAVERFSMIGKIASTVV
ncbi:MAG TPA: 50S ribosomal protein L14 [archaeon]|nr:50S ribosomal protein L14 [archaeon]